MSNLRILILSFYYPPDLSACSFRSTALVKALQERMPGAHVEVITTLPNRYDSFTDHALVLEEFPRLTIRRIRLPPHGSGMLTQARAFVTYARQTLAHVEYRDYDLVWGTSSRLMTAALSARVARGKRLPLCLDIRDIFVDTIAEVLPRRVAWLAKPVFSLVERWTLSRADSVNLVSRGFEGYFTRRYPGKTFTYFTNGIDEEFIGTDHDVRTDAALTPDAPDTSSGSGAGDRPMTVLYAGNIGEGQGLHTVLPELAKRLEGRAVFRVIGDGGRKRQLENELARAGCTNVDVQPPMKRVQLLEAYRQADVLFLHLNDYSAFEKVLPSKVFEYAAAGKPILAGVAGYAASFVQTEIENAAVFPPCDVDAAVRAWSQLRFENVQRTDFITRYERASIMREMAADIARLLPAADVEAPASG